MGLPPGVSVEGEHCYSTLGAEIFPVRGLDYMDDGVKVPSEDSLFSLAHVGLFEAPGKVSHLATRADMFYTKARAAGDTRFYLIVVFQVPGGDRVHLALYYAATPAQLAADPKTHALWKRFLAGDDAYRNSRWKVIPSIAEGNWIVKKSVGTKPALLGTKIQHDWLVRDTYIECNVDVASSSMASVLTGMLQQYAKYLVIDLGFVLQGESETELPERCLGTVRLSRPDLSKAVKVRLFDKHLTGVEPDKEEARSTS